MSKENIVLEIDRWRERQLDRSKFLIQPIGFRQTDKWGFQDGRICHQTGAFFSVVGLRFQSPFERTRTLEQPFVLQPEVGILGFMADRSGEEVYFLVQAKVEPGNPGGAQLAPSFQCTESNYLCKHGGEQAPYFSCFNSVDPQKIWCDSLQSEQGTLFLDKYNRNVVVEVRPETAQLDQSGREAWRWLSASQICQLLPEDLLFNTDARSVIATCAWEVFCRQDKPFERWERKGGFGEALYHSYRYHPGTRKIDETLNWLEDRRNAINLQAEMIPLEDMSEWAISEQGVLHGEGNHSVSVEFFRIRALDREVANWDQPLVKLSKEGAVTLLAQEVDGVLQFLVRVSHEPGFLNSAQLSVSAQSYHGIDQGPEGKFDELVSDWSAHSQWVQIDCVMSEEGSRFFWGKNRYKIIWLPKNQTVPADENSRWMTLGEISHLKKTQGIFTNEFRSALSLLVHYV